jgi:hypothetical protein
MGWAHGHTPRLPDTDRPVGRDYGLIAAVLVHARKRNYVGRSGACSSTG